MQRVMNEAQVVEGVGPFMLMLTQRQPDMVVLAQGTGIVPFGGVGEGLAHGEFERHDALRRPLAPNIRGAQRIIGDGDAAVAAAGARGLRCRIMFERDIDQRGELGGLDERAGEAGKAGQQVPRLTDMAPYAVHIRMGQCRGQLIDAAVAGVEEALVAFVMILSVMPMHVGDEIFGGCRTARPPDQQRRGGRNPRRPPVRTVAEHPQPGDAQARPGHGDQRRHLGVGQALLDPGAVHGAEPDAAAEETGGNITAGPDLLGAARGDECEFVLHRRLEVEIVEPEERLDAGHGDGGGGPQTVFAARIVIELAHDGDVEHPHRDAGVPDDLIDGTYRFKDEGRPRPRFIDHAHAVGAAMPCGIGLGVALGSDAPVTVGGCGGTDADGDETIHGHEYGGVARFDHGVLTGDVQLARRLGLARRISVFLCAHHAFVLTRNRSPSRHPAHADAPEPRSRADGLAVPGPRAGHAQHR